MINTVKMDGTLLHLFSDLVIIVMSSTSDNHESNY